MEAAYFSSPYYQGPSVKFIFQPDSCCEQNEHKCSLEIYEPVKYAFTCRVRTTFNYKQYTPWAGFLFKLSICRARVKATLCQLLSPFGQVILKGLKGLLRTLTLFILPFSAVLCNSFWVQIFFSILLHSAFYR